MDCQDAADWIVATQTKPELTEKCSKHGCAKQAVEKVWGNLVYYACKDHYAEILELTKND